jgi:formate dehydrogenase gamma subunit
VRAAVVLASCLLAVAAGPAAAAPPTDAECAACHPTPAGRPTRRALLDASVHASLSCVDCHEDKTKVPHPAPSGFRVGLDACRGCHEQAARAYRTHGQLAAGRSPDIPDRAGCHGGHEILPPRDPRSRVNSANLPHTCGQCHPQISPAMARISIHGLRFGLRTPAAVAIGRVYAAAVAIIIGLMALHWLLDLVHHLGRMLRQRPQVRRMRPDEVAPHWLLMVSFIVLAVTGFALKYDTSWYTRLLFGWSGGFELRSSIHRIAAVAFAVDIVWHLFCVAFSRRGRAFARDMLPRGSDFVFFGQRLAYNLGWRPQPPPAGRFTYVEKAEYWALVWGGVVMLVTGVMLWFDDAVLHVLPKGALDVAWVVHFWEAVLATLAIAVWHLYSTIFAPEVYPMNPAWLTGLMPEEMYRAEHPGYAERVVGAPGSAAHEPPGRPPEP